MSLKETLDALDKRAVQIADDIAYYSGGSSINSALVELQGRLLDAYRTGQLVVKPEREVLKAIAESAAEDACVNWEVVHVGFERSICRYAARAALTAIFGGDD